MSRALALLSRNAWPLGFSAAAFTIAVGLPAADSDMWWHLASGKWMVEHRDRLGVDIFSSTATGEPYALGEWLGEVALYLAYAAGSWIGVAVLRATLVAVAAFAVARSALRHAPPVLAVPLASLAIVLSKPTWTDRPQLFTLALFPVLLELCLAARSGSRAALVAAVPVVVVWSDLHAGYALGIALLWIFAVDALLEHRPATGWLVAAALTTFLVSAHPGPLSLISAAGHVAAATRGIAEESPVDVLTPFGALFALFVGAALAAFLIRGGTVLGAFVLVPMLWLALSAQRHVPLFGFAVVPFLSEVITKAQAAATSRSGASEARAAAATSDREHEQGRSRILDLAERSDGSARSWPHMRSMLVIALWIGAIASIATAPRSPDTRVFPVGARDALKASSGVLLNEYDWGGYLIWTVPERPVFVDGRLYPYVANGVLAAYQTAVHVLPGWRSAIDRWNVTQALIRPDRALAQALRDDGWSVRSEGEGYVLLERPR